MRILFLVTLCIFVSCSQENRVNKFDDPIHVKIADFQDRRQSDSLYQFFNHENPEYRKAAVLAFASIQDTLAIKRLGKVLDNDSDENVRIAAAYALGQTGTEKSYWSLMDALIGEKNGMDGFVPEKNGKVLREITESLGKTSLGGIDTSNESDFEGYAWSYYRLGLRGLADSTVANNTKEILNNSSLNARIGAAHFFARGPKDISAAESILQKSATTDSSVYVRMATTSALRKINTPGTLETIKKILNTDSDYRVRISAVRALQAFPIKDVKQNLFAALNDTNQQVAVAASEVIKSVATKDEFTELVTLARAAKNWRVQGNLFEAALAVSNNKEISEEVIKLYSTVENPYAKAALIAALGQSTLGYSFINEQLHQSKIPVIKSTAAAALVNINSHKEFSDDLRKLFIDIYKKAFETGDAAVIGTIASALGDSTLGYKKVITDFTFLYDAKKKLSLPKDNEALQPLEAAIAHFEGKKLSNEVKNEFNHPIDWNLVKTIPANQKVLIKTGKGDITIQLLVEEAPGSVANFIQLVNSKYFDSKNFHRVVPNFVIQGGCNRGDGWGSEDYSIRSEFSMRRYTEGSVGMASAGKDTEGTQWFITHSPTPHLDGRYTIFAIVTEGMNVVHQMEVGDTILKVELLK
jgi:cyclophilin family peptidyl-prolyl cis-trans isomerase/HEAT repeat protein